VGVGVGVYVRVCARLSGLCVFVFAGGCVCDLVCGCESVWVCV
jgi:hypothetical protein